MPSLNLPLKLALVATKKKQKRIARLLKIPPTVISQIVRGHRPGSEEQRKRLAEFLGKDVNELFPDHAA